MAARFDGKVAIVTGGGSGIGAAIARRFLAEGACVAIAGRSRERLEAEAANRPAERILVQPTDVARLEEVTALVEATVARFGRLDVMVNNAGIGTLGRVTDMSVEQWREVMATSLDSVFFGAKAALPHLVRSQGSMINVSSISGIGADHGFAAYNAAKAAIINLTRTLALDHAAEGVRVNCLSPGLVITPANQPLVEMDLVKEYARVIPLGRAAAAEEMAGAVLFLASEDASFITGVNLVADGGQTIATGSPDLLAAVARAMAAPPS